MSQSSSQDLKNFYTGEYVSQFPDEDPGRIRKLWKFINFHPSDTIADFACGNGLLLDFVHENVHEYYGVDFSEEFVTMAQKRAERKGIRHAHFICDDIVHFCQKHLDFFDKAFTLDFSEHIYDDDFLNIYASIRSSLKPGGVLYLHTPNADYVMEILRRNNILLKPLPPHVAVRNAVHYERLLTEIGFTKIQVWHIPHYVPLLAMLHGISCLPLVGKYLKARIFIVCEK